MPDNPVVCTACGKPVTHVGHAHWFAGDDWVFCVPCRDDASPMGRMRARVADIERENSRLREGLEVVRACLLALAPLIREAHQHHRETVEAAHLAVDAALGSAATPEEER